jgi:hypothetical protein
MEQSILISTKKILGISEDYTVYDLDIITHINTAFSTLAQLGVGPVYGFMIEDESAVWSDFIPDYPTTNGTPTGDDLQFNSVKSYVFLKVRQLFDPPQTSYLIAATEKQIQELEWRLNVHREESQYTDPEGYPVNPEAIEDAAYFSDMRAWRRWVDNGSRRDLRGLRS